MSADWQVSKSGYTCSKTGRQMEIGESYYSGLCEEADTFQRYDFCTEAWEDLDKEQFFSHWKTKVPPPQEKKKLVIDIEAFYMFFTQLENVTEPNKLLFRYMVALILTRKRILRLEGVEKTAEGDYLNLYDTRAKTEIQVFSPEATPQQLMDVQESLNQIFECRIGPEDL